MPEKGVVGLDVVVEDNVGSAVAVVGGKKNSDPW